MIQLPFGLSFTLPTITFAEWLQILVAISVPLVMYRITEMSQVLKWTDMVTAMGLVVTPVVVILGIQGVLGGTAIVAILSAIMLSALGIIVTD